MRFTVYALFESCFPDGVTIQAGGPKGPIKASMTVNKDKQYIGDVVHKIATRRLIRDLEEEGKQTEACKLSIK